MASRTAQKREARERRLAEEQARSESERRQRRLRMVGGVVVLAVAVVAIAIAISSGNSGNAPKATSSAAKADASQVDALLAGIPQSGQTLGNPNAPVTVTEYGDLECSVCDAFADPTSKTTSAGVSGTGYEEQLISQYVRTGKIKLVYRSLETASSGNPDSNAFLNQQTAAYAAGLQNKAWYYITLFYYEQGQEDTAYVTSSYLNGLAKQVPGLNFSAWETDLGNSSLKAAVNSDNTKGTAAAGGTANTPTIVASGPKGSSSPIVGLPGSFGDLSSAISQVS